MTENHPVTLPPLSISTLAKIHKVEGYLIDRKSTRLNSSHLVISYAVFCLKKKKRFFIRYSQLFPNLELTTHRVEWQHDISLLDHSICQFCPNILLLHSNSGPFTRIFTTTT